MTTISNLERQFPRLTKVFEQAQECNFPAYLKSVEESDPMNASPYVISFTRLCETSWSGARQALIQQLVQALESVRVHGVVAEVMLLGGSFLDLSTEPRDLDCLILYSRASEAPSNLSSWQLSQRAHGLDIRLAPIEADPMLVLKIALFFGVLYTRSKHQQQDSRRGLLLVDCSGDAG